MGKSSTYLMKLELGPACPAIAAQITGFGLRFDTGTIAAFQQDHDAIAHLSTRGLLGAQFQERLYQKLGKNVTAHLAKLN